MTIKSSRENLYFIIFTYLALLFVGGLCVFQNHRQVAGLTIFGVAIWVFATAFCLRWCLAIFRTISLMPDGVTISIFHICKFYPWDSITVHYESYVDRLYFGRKQYKGAVLMIPNGNRRPKRIYPLMYCIFFHPISFVFINFTEESLYPDAPGVYAVQKQEFISKMTAWNVLNEGFGDR